MKQHGNAGQHRGGIRTLADVRARCEEVGECWEWQRTYTHGGKIPCAKYQRRGINVRRLAWMLAHGGHIDDGLVVVGTCGNHRCVSPAHLRALPWAEAQVLIASKPSSSARRAKISATVRAKSRVTPGMRQAAVSMGGTVAATAAALGISKSAVSRIRRAAPPAGSLWAGLMRGAA